MFAVGDAGEILKVTNWPCKLVAILWSLEGRFSLPLHGSNQDSFWRERASRIAQVSWDELHTRVRQALDKRIDLVHYYAGLQRHPPLRNDGVRGVRRFFFSPDDLQTRAQLLRKHLSQEVERIIREADEISCHRFRLLGYTGLDYGVEVDWHLDAVHGIRAPLRAAHKTAFLDYSLVGDHKVIWELNRHQHLVTLAKAWVLTHEGKYASEIVRQWYSWQDANPCPLGINWVSALEVAFRSLSWLWVRFLLAGCPALPPKFEPDLMGALALNGSYIQRYLSTYFSPNTHLLGELTALFFIGVLCPQISKAEDWRSLGWSGLLQQAERQVRSDGVYFEQSLYYHVYALDFFLHARALALVNGIEAPYWLDAVLQRMLVFLRTMTQAGPPPTFGDDDGGRVFNPGRNRCEHLTDPLILGAALFERSDLATAPITEEVLWIVGEPAIALSNGRTGRPQLGSTSFEDAGIYVIASSEGQAFQMVIDAGPMGAGRAGHGHADALSATVSFDQRPWLIDPGTFAYVPAISRNRFRSTSAHNTWTIDGLDHAEPSGPFAWNATPEVHREHWVTGETFALFSARHSGYCRLNDPVIHRRFVFYLQARFWLVRDVLEGNGVHNCASSWHFAPDLEVQKVGDAFLATQAESAEIRSSRLALVPAQAMAWNCELTAGLTSPVYGVSETAPVFRMNRLVQLPTECAIMIVPLLTVENNPGTLQIMNEDTGRQSETAIGYVYTEQDQSHFMFFANGEADWQLGHWSSDANFLYCCIQGDEVKHLVICEGRFARFAGKTICTRNKRAGWFEWLAQNDEVRVFSSEKDRGNVAAWFSSSDVAPHQSAAK